MGLLDAYGIDTDNVEVPSYDVEDGWYRFTIGDCYVKEGSTNNPDLSWLIIDYQLEDEDGNPKGKKSDLFQLPEDPENPTEDEQKKLGWYVARMLNLGFKREEVGSIERDDLIGLTGTLQLATRKGKGKNKDNEYQNIVKLTGDPMEEAEAPAAPAAPAKKPAAKRTAATATAPTNPFAAKK